MEKTREEERKGVQRARKKYQENTKRYPGECDLRPEAHAGLQCCAVGSPFVGFPAFFHCTLHSPQSTPGFVWREGPMPPGSYHP